METDVTNLNKINVIGFGLTLPLPVLALLGWLPAAWAQNVEIIHDFTCIGDVNQGCRPKAGLLEGRDGWLYGTLSEEGPVVGPTRGGAVFKLQPDGTGFEALQGFACTDGFVTTGCHPVAGVVEGRDGWLYGTTSRAGGFDGGGSV